MPRPFTGQKLLAEVRRALGSVSEEGCDMMVSEEGATKPAPGPRQVA